MSGSHHVLYHFNFSLWSILTRYSIAVGRNGRVLSNLDVEEKHITIAPPKFEQLTEDYLCRINGNGAVPVLELPDGTMLPDSLAITKYLAQNYYPDLLPTAHESRILDLVNEMRGISLYSLTMKGNSQPVQGLIKMLEGRMADEGCSTQYREAIAKKIQLIKDNQLSQLGEKGLQNNVSKLQELLKRLDVLLQQSSTPWFLDLPNPSTLDLHVVVYCARVFDLKREELVPELLKSYAEKARNSQEWQQIMQGRTTVPPGM